MNRREFLLSMLALGAAPVIPVAIDVATVDDSSLNDAWTAVENTPIEFYVNGAGTLSTQPTQVLPGSRAAMYGIPVPQTRQDVIALLEHHPVIETPLEVFFSGLPEDQWTDDWAGWITQAEEDRFAEVLACVAEWIEGYPGEGDLEKVLIEGHTGQGEALRFFSGIDCEVLEALNIAIIEGEHPGSSYYAAQLRMEIIEANMVAKRNGIPLFFVSVP